MSHAEHRVEIQALTETLIFEMTKALALPQTDAPGGCSAVLRKGSAPFAELGAGLDPWLPRRRGRGARWVLPRFVKSHAARGVEIIPPEGPLVIASNHPASVDSLVISADVDRPDYKIIVGDIPFFENLPHLSQHSIFAPGQHDIHGRMTTIRDASAI